MAISNRSSMQGVARGARTAISLVVIAAMLLVLLAQPAQAVTAEFELDWAGGLGGSEPESGAVALDTAGNRHVAGNFQGTIDLDPGSGATNVTSAGGRDAFLAVIDPAGQLVHSLRIGSTGEDEILGVATDAAGNSHVTGNFEGTVDFDPGSGTTNLTSNGGRDTFLAVYSPTGQLIHALAVAGSTGSDTAVDVATDTAGNTHITGLYAGTNDFDPGPGTTNLTSNGGTDIFLAVYSPTGQLIHALSVGSAETFELGFALATDAAGNSHVVGVFNGSADFDPGPGTTMLTPDGADDGFLAVYSPSGQLIHALTMGGDAFDMAQGVATDAAGNSHVTGFFESSSIDFDPGPGTTNVAGNGGSDAFLAVYAPTGQLIHALGIGGSNGDSGSGVATDAAGNTYVTGGFEGVVDFDPSSGTTNLTAVARDAFLAAYTPTGELIAAARVGGSDSDSGSNVVVDGAGVVHATGGFKGTADLDPSAGTTNLTAAGERDIYLARYTLEPIATPTECNGLTATIDLNATPGAVPTAGDDVIIGTPGSDTIDGLGGNDTICGEGGDDVIDGGDGVDFIYGGDGNDTITGGPGNDRIRGQQGIDNISGGDGNDFLYGGIEGDTINGGPGRDTIGGFGGADTINGGPGNDRIFGGFGGDQINGGPGNDNINGLIGNDTINGGDDNDILNGDQGQDTINGGDGNDTIRGGNSIDTLDGEGGDDNVNGGKSDDALTGGPGTDTCSGNTGTDTADSTCETVFGIP